MMGIDWATRKRRSGALGTGGGGPAPAGGGASGAQRAKTQRENARPETDARARNRKAKGLPASASVSAPPQVPAGPAAAHGLNSPPPPPSMSSFSVSRPVQAVMPAGTTGIHWATRKRRSDALGTGRRAPAGGGAASGTHQRAAKTTRQTPQRESKRPEARARKAKRPRALSATASASASVSAPPLPRMPGPAPHLLNSPMRPSSFTASAALRASALQEFQFLAACADARAICGVQLPPAQARELEARKDRLRQQWGEHGASVDERGGADQVPPKQQQAHEEAAREEDHPQQDHPQQQRWGDHFIDAADADVLAAEYAGMLLDESLHEQQTENEKRYWEGVMHLVNSPLETSASAAVPPAAALEAAASSSAAAALQTSVGMPAPQASSSAASVAVPPPDAQLLSSQRWTSDPSV